MLSGKNILVGITGGIAAYKACELIRMFKRQNANVKVICTPNAFNFVTKLTLQNLSQNEVYSQEFEVLEYKPEHISLAQESDIMVIVPATANTIGKIANGICDNLLTSVVCALTKTILLAPAMNSGMWQNKIIQKNIEKLEQNGYEIIGPEEGFLACGTNGIGRLCSLEKIFQRTVDILDSKKKLSGKKIVITAGGTIENIDPVRFISNYSSGKMGIALADTAFKFGADVVLISTVNVNRAYNVIKVKSAIDMQNAVEQEFLKADCLIMAAAVADYRAKNIYPEKMKKTSDNEISIELIKNPDILQEICKKKSSQVVVGFCAESENLVKNAEEKIIKKGCDYLIANDISRSDIGFSSDYNEVIVLNKQGGITKLERSDKYKIAEQIFEVIYGQERNIQDNREFCTSESC